MDRVKKEGGIILDERVGGALAITRAFGDYALKRDGVSAKPSIMKYFLKQHDKFLVIASDGIWDVLEDEDTCKLCREELSTKEISQHIIKAALENGSTDNCSCLVIRLNSTSPF